MCKLTYHKKIDFHVLVLVLISNLLSYTKIEPGFIFFKKNNLLKVYFILDSPNSLKTILKNANGLRKQHTEHFPLRFTNVLHFVGKCELRNQIKNYFISFYPYKVKIFFSLNEIVKSLWISPVFRASPAYLSRFFIPWWHPLKVRHVYHVYFNTLQ